MKKDAVTIAIVVICIAALIYFLWGTISLMQNTNSGANAVEESAVDNLEDDGVYKFEDEEADTTDSYDYDLDDEQLDTNYGEEEEVEDSSDEDNFSAQKEEDDDVVVEEDLGSGEYLVLAGSFSIKANAEREARRINRLDCCTNAQVSMFNRGAYAVVLVDRFDDESSAKNLVTKLKDEGIQARVHKKR